MAWEAETAETTQTGVAQSETALGTITLTPGEVASAVVEFTPNGGTDDAIVRVYRSTDDGTSYATIEDWEGKIPNPGSGVTARFPLPPLADAETYEVRALMDGGTDTGDFTLKHQGDGVNL